MARFLRENWLWIVLPIAIVLALFAVLVLTRDEQSTPDFIYPIM